MQTGTANSYFGILLMVPISKTVKKTSGLQREYQCLPVADSTTVHLMRFYRVLLCWWLSFFCRHVVWSEGVNVNQTTSFHHLCQALENNEVQS